jgi:DNA polymerase-3 subunit gamma/tau
MTEELYKKCRPTKFNQVIGQEKAIRILTSKLKAGKLPRTILLSGPSGCGKTTIARILMKKVGCVGEDGTEVNGADFRGIDKAREINRLKDLSPMFGKTRCWLIDEVHQLTKESQSALLKTLEDTPKHVYFFLCTNEPQKLMNTIRTRCLEIRVEAIKDDDMKELIRKVLNAENIPEENKMPDEVYDLIVEVAEGSARKALVLLDSIINMTSADKAMQAIRASDSRAQAIELCRALIKPKPQWTEVQKILKSVDEEPESLRRMMLGYCNTILLSGNRNLHARAYMIMQVFRDHTYDAGKPGLTVMAYEVCIS